MSRSPGLNAFTVGAALVAAISAAWITSPAEVRGDPAGAVRGDYLGQEPPRSVPVLFAPGLVSTKLSAHSYPSFSPDGDQVYWSAYATSFRDQRILFMSREGGAWSEARIARFSGILGDGAPVFSPDGTKLFFNSMRPLETDGLPGRGATWVVERKGSGWGEPKPLPSVINSGRVSMQVSVVKNGTIYFAAWRGERARHADIYRSRFTGGEYAPPERLGDRINSKHQEVAPYVAPDESYLIFTSIDRPDGLGSGDLYVSFREEDGGWSAARNMGAPVNTPHLEAFAGVSPDGKYLFFTSERDGRSAVYWVDAGVIRPPVPRGKP